MNRTLTRIGKIDVLQSPPPSATRVAQGCVVLFHGYGADYYDLSSLAEASRVQSPINWYFPQGFMEVPIGPHMSGRAWFPIDIAALDEAIRQGRGRDLGNVRPQGIDRARALAFDMIDQLPFPKSKIIVGGFSQGAMLATELALSSAEPFAGLIVLSGSLLDQTNWQKRAQARPGFRFFQSHGNRDLILPVELAQDLARMLDESGWHGSLYEFRGGHEIPRAVVDQMASYIRDRVKTLA